MRRALCSKKDAGQHSGRRIRGAGGMKSCYVGVLAQSTQVYPVAAVFPAPAGAVAASVRNSNNNNNLYTSTVIRGSLGAHFVIGLTHCRANSYSRWTRSRTIPYIYS